MRFGGRRESDNVESQSGGGGLGFGGGGGGGASMLFGLVFSRFGIGGVLVLFLIMYFIGGSPLGLTGGGEQAGPAPKAGSGQSVCATDPARRFSCQVLASTEDAWNGFFQAQGRQYQPPVLVFYPGSGNSGCGAAQAAMGPFYCPADHRIYLDTSFFDELARRYAAPGDFAQAYVIAHEVGHHIQALTGVEQRLRRAQGGVSEEESNALQVRMELQADCYAGVWAAHERNIMEPGDIEEGMTAAAAIGDDTLQRASRGRVVPESFTHGSSAQRQQALQRGLQGGNPAACDAYLEGT
ncbi:MAG TPA: neutral zinc metallopeptidase [Allosphingosinicella sp.]